MTQLGIAGLVITTLCIVQRVHASWWYLGIASSVLDNNLAYLDTPSKCTAIPFLETRQKELCQMSDNMLDVLSEGASMGIDECKFQFKDRRWNCNTFNTTDVFGNVLSINSREKSYIYAVNAAGAMYAVTKACAKGKLTSCGCDPNIKREKTDGTFEWGGCSHNVRFGERFTKDFVDTKEFMKAEAPSLMNLWNNKAGRKGITKNLKLLCKCHGVSGSCSMKICWRTMDSFRSIGLYLKGRFDGASKVKLNKKKNRLRPVEKTQKKPTKLDLVYLEESPDYCEYNPDLGAIGTSGRLCNKTSPGLDGCQLMCCGRGYYTTIKEIQEDCDCKFYWCCRVECKKCKRNVEEHYCN
ncbi:protein Wnt-2b-like [Tubulanus polymorphus]|uniref:protein Wnt-2b-like n=1 Tax=Tubulanus polymorphus TaxID=672921 RepID=UPI003DA33726